MKLFRNILLSYLIIWQFSIYHFHSLTEEYTQDSTPKTLFTTGKLSKEFHYTKASTSSEIISSLKLINEKSVLFFSEANSQLEVLLYLSVNKKFTFKLFDKYQKTNPRSPPFPHFS
jgi:hypothetical protein